MSLDRRLREGVDRLTSDIDPDVERHLHTSRTKARRRIVVRRLAVTAAAVAGFALVLVAGPRVLDAVRSEPVPADQPTVGPEAVAGTYAIEIAPDTGVVDEQGLAGTWTFELAEDGSMVIDAPNTFIGTVEGYTWEIEGGVLRTDAFVNDLCNEAQGAGVPVGEYRWEVIGGDLILDVRSDRCEARTEILGGILRSTE